MGWQGGCGFNSRVGDTKIKREEDVVNVITSQAVQFHCEEAVQFQQQRQSLGKHLYEGNI